MKHHRAFFTAHSFSHFRIEALGKGTLQQELADTEEALYYSGSEFASSNVPIYHPSFQVIVIFIGMMWLV